MAYKLPSHLHRSRSGILHFRIAIPPDLRHYFASNEIYKSLRTPDVRAAAIAAMTLSIKVKNLFAALRAEPQQQTMANTKNQTFRMDYI
ncbi:hypothetical protein GJ700_20335 [Duganella sp. FT92W]|uniref:DUF6538 domain-containing protein n=1 Tax=Pseudoduganella rivuli TaxID=2666085 RepID=A0A7X2IQ34_9BURK|nr:DUF6538 domain-containing protein [Pseudoduganella rivuli]MRV74061.1 hypothetical protein [Pseudoduganella rivuli]